jgi:hypothetical protein
MFELIALAQQHRQCGRFIAETQALGTPAEDEQFVEPPDVLPRRLVSTVRANGADVKPSRRFPVVPQFKQRAAEIQPSGVARGAMFGERQPRRGIVQRPEADQRADLCDEARALAIVPPGRSKRHRAAAALPPQAPQRDGESFEASHAVIDRRTRIKMVSIRAGGAHTSRPYQESSGEHHDRLNYAAPGAATT